MKPELAATIAESNVVEAERAREAARKQLPDGFWSETAIQFDTLGQIGDLGMVVVNGARTAGDCMAAVCDAIPNID